MVARRAPPSRDNVNTPHPDVKRRVPSGAPIGAAIGVMIPVADKQRSSSFAHQPESDRNGLRRAATSVPYHAGRIFSTAGDSVVAEFGSAVEAVRSAISVRENLKFRPP